MSVKAWVIIGKKSDVAETKINCGKTYKQKKFTEEEQVASLSTYKVKDIFVI